MERKEWKSFRKEMSTESKLQQCGKKLLRHCDVNRDNRIGFTEWLNCLNVNRIQTQTQPTGNHIVCCIHTTFSQHNSVLNLTNNRNTLNLNQIQHKIQETMKQSKYNNFES